MLNAMQEKAIEPVGFCYMDWPTGIVALHTGIGPLQVGSVTFDGIGALGRVELPNNAAADAVSEAKVSIVGFFGDTTGLLDSVALIGREVALATGLIVGGQVVQDPVFSYYGFIDGRSYAVRRDGDRKVLDVTITLSAGNNPAAAISQRRKPSDGGAWIHLADMAGDPPTWPG